MYVSLLVSYLKFRVILPPEKLIAEKKGHHCKMNSPR